MPPVIRTHLRHLLTLTLVSLQIWTPLLSQAWADEVTPLVPTSAGTTLDKAANGVPVVVIAAPSAAGVSHNTYSEFNIGTSGLILNNSAQPTHTQLGGYVLGNANAAVPARLILNEVNGNLPSQLRGYMEVAGQRADVVVANPSGITCNGCGFINTNHATMSTGTPQWGADGSLSGFMVRQGALRVEGLGLNASNVERLELYGRALELNANVHAATLAVAVGAQTVTAGTGDATPLAGTGTAPAFALDSSALGGMYANTIRLIGTEAGLGMRLAGPIAALTGNLAISANGDVHLARASSAGAMALTSSGQMSLSDAVTAEGPLTSQSHALTLTDTAKLSAGQATLQAQTALQVAAGASIAARGDLSLKAVSLSNAGQIGALGPVQVNSTTVTNSGQLEAQQTLQLSSHQLTTTAGSRLGAAQAVTLNLGELTQAGLLSAGSTLQIDASGAVSNSGTIEANSGLSLNAASLTNPGQMTVSAGALALNVQGALNNQGGQIRHGGAPLTINAASLDNQHGQLSSSGPLTLTLSGDLMNASGLLQSGQALTLSSASLNNNAGQLLATGPLQLTMQSGAINNQRGVLRSDSTLNLRTLGTGGHVDNSSNGQLLSLGALTINLDDGALNNDHGWVQSNSDVTVSSAGASAGITNSAGTISSQAGLDLNTHSGALNNHGGHLLGGTATAHSLQGQALDNYQGEIVMGEGAVAFNLPGLLDNRWGAIKHSGSALNISASALDNQSGIVATEGVLSLGLTHSNVLNSASIGATSLLNNSGTLQGNTGLTLSSDGMDNQSGHVSSNGALGISLHHLALDNSSGMIESTGALTLTQLVDVNNSDGKLLADGDISVSLAHHALNNRNGVIETTQNLTVSNAISVSNHGGTLRATKTLNLDLPTFTSSTVGGLIRAAGALNLHSGGAIDMDTAEFSTPGTLWLDAGAADITIRHRVLSGGDLRLTGNNLVVGNSSDTDDGFVASQAGLFVTANRVSNDGVLYGQNAVVINAEDVVSNGDASTVTNAAIVSNGDITITRADGSQLNTVNNYAGQIESLAGNVTIKATTINNINFGWAVAAETIEEKPIYYHDDYSPTGQRSDIVHSSGIAYRQGSYYWSLTWDDAIAGYPRDSAANSCSNGACYYFFRDKEVVTHRNVSRQGDQAHIMASAAPASGKGNIWLEAVTVNNNRSVISAAGLLDIDVGISGGNINNVASVLFDVSDINRETRWKSCGSSGACSRGQDIIDLATNDLASRNDQRIPAILEGGLLVNLHGTVVNGTPESTGHTVTTGLGAFIDPNRPTTAPTDATAQGGTDAAEVGTDGVGGVAAVGGNVTAISPAVPLDPTAAPGFHLPGNGIFHLANNPAHPYLIETDPALNTYNGFLGSGYLINHLHWQPGITQRRLGDSYYELQLVRTTLLASLGTRFIDPKVVDERQQFEDLMNNAIAASDALQLSPGISLSRSQIDALEQDIIWLEEKTIASQKVLVPVVYLAQGSSRLLSDGAVIGGGNITIDGSEFKNAGLVRSGNKINITSTKTLENIGGAIQAVGDIKLNSGDDILNESGTISGRNVTLLADGDIINRTWHEDDKTITGAYEEKVKQKDGSFNVIKHEGNSQWSTRVGDTASITATGHLIQQAANDILIEGGALSGQDIALIAGNDVIISAIEALQGYKSNGGNWQQSEEHVRQLQSTITSSLDLSISASNDLTAIAAELNAGGNASLHAGNNVSLLAATESDHSESHRRDKKGSSDYVDDRQRNLGTSLTAGGNLEITSDQGNVSLYASSAAATGDVDVSAGGDVNVIAGIDSAYHSESEVKKSTTKISTHKEGYSQQTAAQSGIISGGTLTLKAGGDVTLTASTLAANDTLNIGDAEIVGGVLNAEAAAGTTPNNVNVNTLALTNETWNESSSGYRGIGKELMRVAASLAATMPGGDKVKMDLAHHANDRTKDVLQAGSALAATHLDINAKDTVNLISANVDVKEHASISATDIVFGTAVETHTTRHDVGSDDVVGLDAKLGKDEVRVGGAQETKHSLVDSTTLIHNKGSTLNAGTLSLNAINNIEAYNVDITVTGDASLNAGNQLVLSGKEDVLTSEHKEVTEVITVAAAVRNAYVDAALTIKAMADAKDAIKDAKKALSDAEDKASRGELDPDDVKYFRINLEAAKANLVQMGVAMAAALAMGAAAAGTGFYASGSAQRDKTTTTSTTSEGSWQGSTLNVGGNASLTAGEKIKIQGSDVNVQNALTVNAKKIELLAGEEHYASTSKTTQEHEGINISSSGGGSANASLRQTDADASGMHYVNAHLTAGTLNSKSDSLRIAGGNIEADNVAIETKKLTVVSVQDTYQSKSKTIGMGVGISGGKGGVSGGSLSGEFQKSTAEKAWVDEQSGIIGHSTIAVKAEDTVLTGAVIANARRDENGELIDQGHLKLKTNTLQVNDLFDVDKSKTVGGNFAVSMPLGGGKDKDKDSSKTGGPANGTPSNAPAGNTSTGAAKNVAKNGVPFNTLTVGGVYNGHTTERTSHATLGMGDIEVGGETLTDANKDRLISSTNGSTLNRNLSNAQEITKDQDIGGLNASVTVDGRWFSDAGRKEMVQQAKDVGKNAEKVGAGLAVNGIYASTIVASVVTGEVDQMGAAFDKVSSAKDISKKDAALAKTINEVDRQAIVNTPELSARLDGVLSQEDKNTGNRVRLTDDLTDEHGIAIAGAASKASNTIYVSTVTAAPLVDVMAHEAMHINGAGEKMAGATGWLANAAFAMGNVLNQDAINSASAYNFAVLTPAASQANAHQFTVEQVLGKTDNFGSVGHQSTTAAGMYLGGFSAEIAKAGGVSAFAADAKVSNAMSIQSLLHAGDPGGDQQHTHLIDGETNKDKVKQKQTELTQVLEGHFKVINAKTSPQAIAEYLNDPEVQRDLHAFGDSFAHVNAQGEHYAPGLGHVLPSLGSIIMDKIGLESFSHSNPDDPAENPEAYAAMFQAVVKAASNATGKPRAYEKDISILSSIVSNTQGKNAEETEKLQMQVLQQKLNDYYPIVTTNPATHQAVITPPNVVEVKNLDDWGLLGAGDGTLLENKNQVESGINAALRLPPPKNSATIVGAGK